ncbi:uncharacterized protein SPPG_02484 [Spizellomyces punctatus DAOM BR117]|uniref:Uncharacterized protein n=1 Tax=Spizellomyces punctatus (strain DAOM BR117) TaxID=645134 RepID=A0A0L0HLI2_SPIPD|nr:uncharacterized protein SPPG_02484 [Spizellomyces punctatus DAOM BR117]KND01977.1 hypothetical protein SPPG_02484 [Spizellomyces punctatus DAOM BR117]|eukprot:XP_016610016.1 hypothetical protein SPPG_02484 [Spizellomyces punctatus DAOM BR117]
MLGFVVDHVVTRQGVGCFEGIWTFLMYTATIACGAIVNVINIVRFGVFDHITFYPRWLRILLLTLTAFFTAVGWGYGAVAWALILTKGRVTQFEKYAAWGALGLPLVWDILVDWALAVASLRLVLKMRKNVVDPGASSRATAADVGQSPPARQPWTFKSLFLAIPTAVSELLQSSAGGTSTTDLHESAPSSAVRSLPSTRDIRASSAVDPSMRKPVQKKQDRIISGHSMVFVLSFMILFSGLAIIVTLADAAIYGMVFGDVMLLLYNAANLIYLYAIPKFVQQNAAAARRR